MSALMMSSTLVAELSLGAFLAFALGAGLGEFCSFFWLGKAGDFCALLFALLDDICLSLRELVMVLAFFLVIYGLNFS